MDEVAGEESAGIGGVRVEEVVFACEGDGLDGRGVSLGGGGEGESNEPEEKKGKKVMHAKSGKELPLGRRMEKAGVSWKSVFFCKQRERSQASMNQMSV